MAPSRSGSKPTLIPVGFQTMTLSNSTALAVNSTVAGPHKEARVLDLSVETNAIRLRADGVAPTRTTGVLLATGYYRLEGFNAATSVLKFQRSTGTSKVSIQSWKLPGD